MKWNVYYSWQGERLNGGQYDRRADAEKRANELRNDNWNDVYVAPTDSPRW